MDLHAHLSSAEVIGLLGGRWEAAQKRVEVVRAFPCRRALGSQSGTAWSWTPLQKWKRAPSCRPRTSPLLAGENTAALLLFAPRTGTRYMTLQYVRLQSLLQTQAWRLVLLYSCCPAWQANRWQTDSCRKDRNVIGMLLHAGTTPILCLRRNHPEGLREPAQLPGPV